MKMHKIILAGGAIALAVFAASFGARETAYAGGLENDRAVKVSADVGPDEIQQLVTEFQLNQNGVDMLKQLAREGKTLAQLRQIVIGWGASASGAVFLRSAGYVLTAVPVTVTACVVAFTAGYAVGTVIGQTEVKGTGGKTVHDLLGQGIYQLATLGETEVKGTGGKTVHDLLGQGLYETYGQGWSGYLSGWKCFAQEIGIIR